MPATYTDRLDGLTTSVAVKAPCRVATTTAITLSGTQTVDGVALSVGDRVLVKNQASSIYNGIWLVASGAWSRALDFDGARDAVGGTMIYVSSGSTNSNSWWQVGGTGEVVVGTDAITIAEAIIGDSATASFLQAGTGAVSRTGQNKMRDIVSVKDFGAIGDGVTDDTVAIQAAIDSGAKAVYVPGASYVASSLLMPNVFGFVLFGDGPSSILIQKAGASGALIRWSTAAMVYNEHTVRNIGINGNVGSQHCIDISGAGGVTLDGIYITDVPVGKSGIYVNGTAATYTHDPRLMNIQIYSNTAGHSGIRCGPLTADTAITDFIMNGNFVTSYCIYADINALTTTVSNSHPYNAAINIVKLAGTNNSWSFDNCVLDNATNDLVVIVDSGSLMFTGCFIEAIKSGYSGVNISGSGESIVFVNTRFDGAAGALSCIKGGASAHGILAFGGQIPSVANFTTPFDLAGLRCSARGFGGWAPFGMLYNLSGVTPAVQAQSTTQYLGAAASATEVNAGYLVPKDSKLAQVYISTSAAPAAGQTFTFQARKNGSNIGSSLVFSSGTSSGTLTLGTSFSQFDLLTISSVFSATSGSANIRWCAELIS